MHRVKKLLCGTQMGEVRVDERTHIIRNLDRCALASRHRIIAAPPRWHFVHDHTQRNTGCPTCNGPCAELARDPFGGHGPKSKTAPALPSGDGPCATSTRHRPTHGFTDPPTHRANEPSSHLPTQPRTHPHVRAVPLAHTRPPLGERSLYPAPQSWPPAAQRAHVSMRASRRLRHACTKRSAQAPHPHHERNAPRPSPQRDQMRQDNSTGNAKKESPVGRLWPARHRRHTEALYPGRPAAQPARRPRLGNRRPRRRLQGSWRRPRC